MPFKPAVEADLSEQEWTQTPGGPLLLAVDARRPNQRMRAFAARLELPTLDPHATLFDNLANRGREALSPDSHRARSRNRLAAAAAETCVKEGELIPH